MTSLRPRFCFAALLLLWQLMPGGFAHAAPVEGAACGHDQAAHDHGSACESPQCGCPCGHTPALRIDVGLDGKVAPPAERPTVFVDAVLPDPIEEHFRPPN